MPGVVPANYLSPNDTAGIVKALFEHAKPLLVDAHNDYLDSVEVKLDEMVAANGPLVALFRAVVREELSAFESRQPSQTVVNESITNGVVAAVKVALKSSPRTRSVEEMSRAEVYAAVLASLDVDSMRQMHASMLNLRVIANGKSAESKGDGITISFPAQRKKCESFSNKEFSKLIQCVMTKIYGSMAALEEDQRPPIFRKKVALLTKHLDRVDDVVEAVLRNAWNNGRSEARALFHRVIAFYLRADGASIALEHPSAPAPAVGSGKNADYFAIVCELQASVTGDLSTDSADGSDDPLMGVHTVTRKACLYTLASRLLQAIVLLTYTFDAEAVNVVALNLRSIVASESRAWAQMSMKQAEAAKGPCTWALLMPVLADAKANEVQRLTETERQTLVAKAIAAAQATRSTGNDEADGTSGSGNDGGESDREEWLRGL